MRLPMRATSGATEGTACAMADIYGAADPYEHEAEFQTWLGYVIADTGHRSDVPAPGYDTEEVRKDVNWAPDLMRGYDLHLLDDAYEQLQKVWESLDDELHKNTEMVKVIFDGWEGDAKAAAVGYLGSIVDVVEQECAALNSFAQLVVAFYGYVYSARKKIDALMETFCAMCRKKYADAAAEDSMEQVAADLAVFVITTTVNVAVALGTGGTAFPIVVGALGGAVATEIGGKTQDAIAPADDWSDIVDWYLDQQQDLKAQLDEGAKDILARARTVEHPDIDRVAEIDQKHLPNQTSGSKRRTALEDSAARTTSGGRISSRLDDTDGGRA